MILIREVRHHEVERCREIDRSEDIIGYYKLIDGKLNLMEVHELVAGFEESEIADIVERLYALQQNGGAVIGAFEGERLIGITSIENQLRGVFLSYCKMDILYVSKSHRHRGVGQKLVNAGKKAAMRFGAEKLYISATPTKHTIDFYKSRGAILTTELDRELYNKEPNDIHLELRVDDEPIREPQA